MKTQIDARLRAEAVRFRFRFSCDECAHFDPDNERCSLGFAAAPRKDALAHEAMESCKTFELA